MNLKPPDPERHSTFTKYFSKILIPVSAAICPVLVHGILK
jgi:hypothetical protein